MKVLNLYAGIGGNRKLWEDVEVTAVEIDPLIAEIYCDYFPEDKMVYQDAHKYLLDHYKEYDFIWSSPPCQTHSRARFWGSKGGQVPVKYPDMRLYEEIIFMNHYYDGFYCIENVVGYYEPLIKPQTIGRHYLWANFIIRKLRINEYHEHHGLIDKLRERKGFDLSKYSGIDERTILRNCMEPEIGKIILESALGRTQRTLFEIKEELNETTINS